MPEKAHVDLLIHSANQVLTIPGPAQRGVNLGTLGVIDSGAVAAGGDEIVAVGPTAALRAGYTAKLEIDASGMVVMPGLVDPHTHLSWVGDRSGEFEQRLSGMSYMDIMAGGGGIASTVRQVRAASLETIVFESRARTASMLEYGTTTAEAKTGYGLDLATELKLMEALLLLDEEGPLELVPTFLGAHALPPEYAGAGNGGYAAYTEHIIQDMLPALIAWWESHASGRPLPFVDVFCEEGAFSLGQSRAILLRAAELGFPLKIHADEFAGLGGTGLAVELGAASADHLVHTPPADIAALGHSTTVAVSLPCTPFGLGEMEYTPAQELLKADAILAIASDLNPGTAWCESMQFAIALACRNLGLTPAQALASATINAASAVRRAERVGSLEPGKQADILIMSIPHYRHLGYRFGTNLVSVVIKRGQIVVDRR
jgi:imidazolonepropionase